MTSRSWSDLHRTAHPEPTPVLISTVRGGTTVTLDGTASSDVDGSIAAYAWQQTAGTPVTVTGADRATASFSSPAVNTEETLTLTLTVTDDRGATATDSVEVTLLPNATPTAAAGSDHTVLRGSLVSLDGSGSHDSDGQIVSALWRQDGGTPVVLTGADTAIASFTAPRPAADEPLHFSLTVTDDSGASASDEITIIVSADQPPLADAGLDQSVTAGSLVDLHGEGSSDPEGGSLSYRWQQTEGAPVSLTGGDTATPSFAAPSPAADEILGFTLTVTDDEGEIDSDMVRVEIRAPGVTRGPTTRVSMASDGTEGNSWSDTPSLSVNGRYVAFSSSADNLASGDTNNVPDIFVHDRQTATTTRVSVATGSIQGNRGSYSQALSGDGRFVAFGSFAYNLVSGDTNNAPDIFVHDRQTGKTTRVSVATDGTQANVWGSHAPALNADGRYVAFASSANNLVSGDTNNVADIFVHDRETGTTARVSVASDGPPANAWSEKPVLSGDGRYIAFISDANNLVSGDTNEVPDIFVHDRETGTTTRVSVAADGTQANRASYYLAIGADGRYIAFSSDADNLVSGDTNEAPDIFIHDRQTGTTTRLSIANDGTEGNDGSGHPTLSGDGRYVAFTSPADNLTEVDPNGSLSDVFVHDRETGTTRRVSVASDGSAANDQSESPTLSADGRHVTFYSEADNLVIGDTNQASDIFVHERIDTEANEAPRASAGLDRSVPGGTTVTLDGRGSQDPEGGSLSYRWTQTQGPRVLLKNPSAARPRFTIPYVAVPTAFEFTLTVSDDHGAKASDSVLITAQPGSNPRDTRPPRTDYSQTGTTVGGVPGYRITLRPNETATVYFRVTGVGTLEKGGIPTSDWQVYTTRLTLMMHAPGEGTLEYYAIDKAGNVESTQRKTLRRTQ